MSEQQLGKGHIYSLSGGTITMKGADGTTTLTGYVSPNLKTLKLTHSADRNEIKGQAGLTTGLIFNNQVLECQFDIIPEGTSVANAKLSAQLPPAGCICHIASLPVIGLGFFTDALNATTTNPWIYEGGGTINGESEKEWSMTVTLKRYEGITSGSPIS